MSQAGVLNLDQFGPGDVVQTLEGNTGGKVGPDLTNNINVVGDGITANVVGNPATHTLTISASGSVPIQFDADSGTATPAGGILNIFGDPNITTTGSGNTIHVTLNQNVVVTSYSTATPTPVPSSILILANNIEAQGTSSDVDLNISTKGLGAINLVSANATGQISSGSIDFSSSDQAGSFSVGITNTNFTQDIDTFTFDNSAASTLGRITFNSSNAPIVFSGQSEAEYDFFNLGTGTSTVMQNYSQWGVNTTNATPTNLYSATMTAGNTLTLEAVINASSPTTGTDSAFARVWANFAYYPAAGSAVVVGTPVIDFNTTNLSTAVSVSTSGSSIMLQVTGIAAQTWEWTGVITVTGSTIV